MERGAFCPWDRARSSQPATWTSASSLPPLYPPAHDLLIPRLPRLPCAKVGGAAAPEGWSLPLPPLAGPPARDVLILPLPYLPCIPQRAMPSSYRFLASLVQRKLALQRRRDSRSLSPLSRAPQSTMTSSRRCPASLGQRVVAWQRWRDGRSPGPLSRAPLRAMPHPASSLHPFSRAGRIPVRHLCQLLG